MSFLVLSLIVLNTITTGKTYTNSEVVTNIGGEGNVYTRIESEVNGQRQVLEASEPGSYKLEMGEPIISEEPEKTYNQKPAITAVIPQPVAVKTLVNQIEQLIQKLIRNISRLLH